MFTGSLQELTMIEFGKRVKNLRKQKSLTQEQLAKRLWVTKSIISAYESGIKYPSLDMLIKLSYIFNVSTDYLLGISKKQYLDITGLQDNQINILKNLVEEFNKKKLLI